MNVMLAALVLLSSFVIAPDAAQTHPQIGYKSALGAQQEKTQLLRRLQARAYAPRSHPPN